MRHYQAVPSSYLTLLPRPKRHSLRSVALCAVLVSVFLVSCHYSYGADTQTYVSWLSSSRIAPAPYRPGPYGRWLAKRHAEVPGAETAEIAAEEPASMFDLMAGRDESTCAGWTPELVQGQNVENDLLWERCWRAQIWKQIDEFELPWTYQDAPGMLEHNVASLQRLKQCVSQPILYQTPQDDPNYTSLGHAPETPEEIANTPCSLSSTKVVLGSWWYFTCAVLDLDSTGEAIWLKSQIQALQELGYTVIFQSSYDGISIGHRALPDVISHIWTLDEYAMTCLGDPRCVNWAEFEPADVMYPDLGIDADGLAIWPNGETPHDQGHRDRHKFTWTREELDAIPVEERGTIPRHKIFATTYWGSRPSGLWQIPSHGRFGFNSLGSEWTLTPFDYEDHSYLPYTVEDTVMATPYVPPEQRIDRIFVLAKKTDYFWQWTSVIPTFWARAKELTGLGVISTAIPPDGTDIAAPEGVPSLGMVSRMQFAAEMASSRVLIGIGRPEMSPSVYHALGMGTPVLVPYWGEEPIPSGWNRYISAVHQHGPAATYGAPYVYSYKADDEADMVAKIKLAKENPIGRFIPADMTWSAVMSNIDDYMRFDWAKHGQANAAHLRERMTEDYVWVYGRCFEIGKCRPLKDGP